MTETLRSQAWLYMGPSVTVRGDLELAEGRLSFTSRASQSAGIPLYLAHELRALEKKVQHPGLAKKLSWTAIMKDEDPLSEPVKVFDVPFDQVEEATFPWYYLDRGVKLVIRGELFRFSFARPSNTKMPTDKAQLEGIVDLFQAGAPGKPGKLR